MAGFFLLYSTPKKLSIFGVDHRGDLPIVKSGSGICPFWRARQNDELVTSSASIRSCAVRKGLDLSCS